MITSGRTAKALLVVLAITIAWASSARPANASTSASASLSPALPNFGLNMGATGPATAGLTGLWSTLTNEAAARTCINHCPPPSWAVQDPALGPLGKMTSAGIAMGASGLGLAIGGIALRGTAMRSTRKRATSRLRTLLRSLTVKPMPAGAGLSVSF
jgi:hypothetical protein